MRLSAEDVTPPKALWRFLCCNPSDVPWETRLAQLLDGQAYFPSPRKFNDPFDTLPRVDVPSDHNENAARYADMFIAGFTQSVPGEDPVHIAKMVRSVFEHTPPDKLWGGTRASMEKTTAAFGVFCLAECIESVLMWSHYAGKHTGIAIRFNLYNDLRGGLMPVFKARYSESRPPMWENLANEGDALIDALLTKAKFWEYEQEWRCLDPTAAGQFKRFAPEVVTGIVFGALCLPETESIVRRIVGARAIPMMRASADISTFSLRFTAA